MEKNEKKFDARFVGGNNTYRTLAEKASKEDAMKAAQDHANKLKIKNTSAKKENSKLEWKPRVAGDGSEVYESHHPRAASPLKFWTSYGVYEHQQPNWGSGKGNKSGDTK